MQVRAAVLLGPGIDQTKELQRKHAQKALQELEVFDENDARKALSNIIFAMGEIWSTAQHTWVIYGSEVYFNNHHMRLLFAVLEWIGLTRFTFMDYPSYLTILIYASFDDLKLNPHYVSVLNILYRVSNRVKAYTYICQFLLRSINV